MVIYPFKPGLSRTLYDGTALLKKRFQDNTIPDDTTTGDRNTTYYITSFTT